MLVAQLLVPLPKLGDAAGDRPMFMYCLRGRGDLIFDRGALTRIPAAGNPVRHVTK